MNTEQTTEEELQGMKMVLDLFLHDERIGRLVRGQLRHEMHMVLNSVEKNIELRNVVKIEKQETAKLIS